MDPGPSRQSQPETRAVLTPFLDVLRSSQPITIPSQTVLGAITHFLSTLDGAELNDFVRALLTSSSSLWNSHMSSVTPAEIRSAVRLSVAGKLAFIDEDVKDRYFSSARRRGRAREWLGRVVEAACSAEGVGEKNKLHVLIGLLQGLDDVRELDWGNARMKLEEEVVMGIADLMRNENKVDGITLLCPAMSHIDMQRLKALDVKEAASSIEDLLLSALRTDTTPEARAGTNADKIPILAKALARCFAVLASGGSSVRDKQCAWSKMMRFCRKMHDLAVELERGWMGQSQRQGQSSESSGDKVWESHKSALFAFLLISSAILDLLLANSFALLPTQKGTSADQIDPSVDLAGHILWALSPFSYLTDTSSGGTENFHRVMYGCLDVMTAKSGGGTAGTDKLFYHLLQEGDDTALPTPITKGSKAARAAYILVLAEELIHHLSGKSVRPLLLLAEKHIHRPEHKSSFEASHAFLLALLRSSSETLDEGSTQSQKQQAFFDALLPYYLDILTKQANKGQITSDQLRSAFPLIVATATAAARQSQSPKSPNTNLSLALSFLSRLKPSSDERMVRILIAPSIPHSQVEAYLEDLAEMIRAVPAGSEERADLARAAFKMLIEDLGDEVKSVGVDWWVRSREGIEGNKALEKGFSFLRSRL